MTMKKQTEDQKIFNTYLDRMGENDLLGALDELDKLLKITHIKAFVYSLKVDILSQLGRQADALDVANLAVQYPNPPSKLYKLRAELLMSLGQDVNALQIALQSIDMAIQLYEQDSISEDIQAQFDNVESFKLWFQEKTRSRTDMASLKADIKSLLYTMNALERIQQVENNVSQEKVKTIELMAIFTAILALIFANVQFVKNLELNQIIVANFALAAVLTWFLYVAQKIGQNRSILPEALHRGHISETFGKLFGLILVACLSVAVLSGTVLLVVKIAEWIGLK